MPLFREAIRLLDGELFHLPLHQQRVDRTLSHFFTLSTRIDLEELRERIPSYACRGLFKCRLLYGERIESLEFEPYAVRHIGRVGVVVDNKIDYAYKYADRSRLTALLQESGCDEVVIVKQGCVTDASAYNLLFESDEGIFTPHDCLLAGTQRQALLDSGRVRERRIRVEDVADYDSLYFVNAMTGPEEGLHVSVRDLVWL